MSESFSVTKVRVAFECPFRRSQEQVLHLYFKAVARLEGSGGFEVDLVEAQQAVHIASAIAAGMKL